MLVSYYQVLGVARGAPLADIKAAYHTAALRCHPDKSDGDASTEEFRLVQKAWEVRR